MILPKNKLSTVKTEDFIFYHSCGPIKYARSFPCEKSENGDFEPMYWKECTLWKNSETCNEGGIILCNMEYFDRSVLSSPMSNICV